MRRILRPRVQKVDIVFFLPNQIADIFYDSKIKTQARNHAKYLSIQNTPERQARDVLDSIYTENEIFPCDGFS